MKIGAKEMKKAYKQVKMDQIEVYTPIILILAVFKQYFWLMISGK